VASRRDRNEEKEGLPLPPSRRPDGHSEALKDPCRGLRNGRRKQRKISKYELQTRNKINELVTSFVYRRSMPHGTKEPPKDFIRVTLGQHGEVWNEAEVVTMILEGLGEVMAAGAHHFGRINLYLPIRTEKGAPLYRLGKRQLEDITIDGPYRAAAAEFKVDTIITRGPR
jgi:hypothetical protein